MRPRHTIGSLKASGHYTPNVSIWDGIAKRVLAGEFKGATQAEREAVLMGLRTFRTPWTEKAVGLLDDLL